MEDLKWTKTWQSIIYTIAVVHYNINTDVEQMHSFTAPYTAQCARVSQLKIVNNWENLQTWSEWQGNNV